MEEERKARAEERRMGREEASKRRQEREDEAKRIELDRLEKLEKQRKEEAEARRKALDVSSAPLTLSRRQARIALRWTIAWTSAERTARTAVARKSRSRSAGCWSGNHKILLFFPLKKLFETNVLQASAGRGAPASTGGPRG